MKYENKKPIKVCACLGPKDCKDDERWVRKNYLKKQEQQCQQK